MEYNIKLTLHVIQTRGDDGLDRGGSDRDGKKKKKKKRKPVEILTTLRPEEGIGRSHTDTMKRVPGRMTANAKSLSQY